MIHLVLCNSDGSFSVVSAWLTLGEAEQERDRLDAVRQEADDIFTHYEVQSLPIGAPADPIIFRI